MTLALLTTNWWQHVAIVAVYTAVLLAALCWVCGWPGSLARRRFVVGFAITGAIVSVLVIAWWLRPANFNWQESLPLHMCDLAGIIAPVALLTRVRWPRTLLHFWGVGLCSQWVCTPVANAGPQKIEFWISFVLHASILGSAACDVIVRGYRPTWRDWRLAILAGVGYVLVVLPLDIMIGANYGYVGDTRPKAPTIVDHLGPWPLRILWVCLLGTATLTLVQAAWAVLRRIVPTWAATNEPASP